MAKKKIVQTFEGGLAEMMPQWLVPHNAVWACKNFLFEFGELRTRPAVASGTSTLGAGTIIDSIIPMFPPIGGSSPQMYGTYKTSVSDAAMRVFPLQPLYTASATSIAMPPTEGAAIAPAGKNGGFHNNSAQFDNKTYIYGMVDAGGNPFLLQIDNNSHATANIAIPGAITTSRTFGRAWPIVEHLSRILIADPGLPAISRPTVYWCKIGDPTVWTGHYTTGNVQLQEASDGIRAMGVMQNMVVVARPTGFHVGVPTGNATSPYDWKTVTRGGIGCVYPESFVTYGDLCFFAGQANIYMFDLKQVVAIGDVVASELFAWLTWNGFGLRAFVTETYSWRPRPMLHLIPTFTPTTFTNGGAAGTIPEVDLVEMPHFVYDLLEKKWSKHIYDQAAADTYPLEGCSVVWDSFQQGIPNTGAQNTYSRVMLIRRPAGGPAQYMMWDPFAIPSGNFGCDSVQSFTTGSFVIDEDPSVEGKLVRFMVVMRASTDPFDVTVDIDYMQGNTLNQTQTTFTVSQSGSYRRYWVNIVLVGNFFSFKLSFPQFSEVQLRQIVFEFDVTNEEVRV